MEIYDWDVVYACSGSYINQQLALNRGRYIQSFEYEDSVMEVKGAFDAWKLVPGGSEGLLQFECPIESGHILIKDNELSIDLEGTIPLIQMQLKLIKGSSQKVSHCLVFNCTAVGKQKDDTTLGAVTVIDPDVTGTLKKHQHGGLAAELLVTGLGQCMVQNASQLSYVFADVLPAPTGNDSAWLTPKELAYCYQQPDDGSLGGVAILGLLDAGEIKNLPRNFDSDLLLKKDFGFALSAKQFMAHIILPTLPSSMGGNAQANDFSINAGGDITLNHSFDLDKVKVGLVHYTPKVKSLSFQIEDEFMRCYVATKTDITGLSGAYVTNSVSSKNQSSFDVNTRTISFEKDPDMATTQDKHIPWWESLVGVLTLDIMNVVIDAISLAIEDAVVDLDSSKTAESFGQVAPGLVSWTGQNSVSVTNGGVEDNVYFQGIVAG